MYLSAQCLRGPVVALGDRAHLRLAIRLSCTHVLPFVFVPTAGTVHQRWTALPGSSGKHGGRHSLRRRRSNQQRPSAPQLRQGDQREADDVAFFSGEDNSSVQTMDDPSTAGEPIVSRVSPCSAERVHHQSGHGPMSGGGAGQCLLWPPADPAALHWPKVDHQEHNEAVIRGTIFHEEL